jgi:hypothetical protein
VPALAVIDPLIRIAVADMEPLTVTVAELYIPLTVSVPALAVMEPVVRTTLPATVAVAEL